MLRLTRKDILVIASCPNQLHYGLLTIEQARPFRTYSSIGFLWIWDCACLNLFEIMRRNELIVPERIVFAPANDSTKSSLINKQ